MPPEPYPPKRFIGDLPAQIEKKGGYTEPKEVEYLVRVRGEVVANRRVETEDCEYEEAHHAEDGDSLQLRKERETPGHRRGPSIYTRFCRRAWRVGEY